MLAQKLRSSCKCISLGFGLLSSYISYKYQSTVGIQLDESLSENFSHLHRWVQWKTRLALNITEVYLLQYCHTFSVSPLFHRANMTSLLIYLASSDNILLHELCVKLLSVVQFPDEVDVEYYIKQCDNATLVGLARSRDLNLKWFPSKTIENSPTDVSLVECMSKLLKDIQMTLPVSEATCPMWLYKKLKGERYPEDPYPTLMSDFCTERDNASMTTHTEMEDVSEEDILKYLDILRRHSNSERVAMDATVSKRIIHVIKDIMRSEFKDNKNVLFLCGNIIGNVCTNRANRDEVVRKDILTEFVRWKSTKNLTLNVVADRVLYNLDYVKEKELFLHDGIYLCHPTYRHRSANDADVVFIHGINGSPFFTWRLNDTNENNEDSCWPKDWLSVDHPDCRVICVHYDSSLSEWLLSCPIDKTRYSLAEQARSIKNKLNSCGVGTRPIVWVGHSMGGLIIKKLLLSESQLGMSREMLASSKGIVFYSVPHRGSPIATHSEKASFILFPSIEVHELSENSPQLEALHYRFARLLQKHAIKCTDLGEVRSLTLPYIKMKSVVVPQSSSDGGYGRFMLLDADHQDICKPHSKSDLRYTEVSDLLSEVLHHNNNPSKFKKI